MIERVLGERAGQWRVKEGSVERGEAIGVDVASAFAESLSSDECKMIIREYPSPSVSLAYKFPCGQEWYGGFLLVPSHWLTEDLVRRFLDEAREAARQFVAGEQIRASQEVNDGD